MNGVDPALFLNAYAWPLIGLLLTGFIGIAIMRSTNYLNAHATFLSAQTKTKILAVEKDALQEGADYLMAWLQRQAAGTKIPVDGAVTSFAAQIALNHAGGMLSAHGLAPEEAAAKILSRIPPTAIATDTTGAVIKTTTVTTETLQPVGVKS